MIVVTGPVAARDSDTRLTLKERSVLVYNSIIGGEERQFVMRIGRFLPDRVFEWETTAFQGTVHLFRSAVESAETLTYGKLFQAGVGYETKDTVTKWLSGRMYRELVTGKSVKYKLNLSLIHI